jgi:hypothetical protein
VGTGFAALLSNDDDYRDMMERARIEAWRRVSPVSNTHSGCGEECYNAAHYPDGDPLADADDPTQRLRDFLDGKLR